jgi:hypothetical protein
MIQIAAQDLAHIKKISTELKIKPATILAVIDVESAGKLFANVEGKMLPVIRWEGHYFDRLVNPKLRESARKAGLASPVAGKIKNPASQAKRYDILNKAIAIDPEAAYSSISIGIGQVMGAHWKDLGYKSAEDMFDHAMTGLSGQLDLMMDYIKENDLVDELQRNDWSAFARGYNGPAYRKNKYDTNLKKAFDLYNDEKSVVVTTSPGSADMLRMGSQGERVRELQRLLTRAGFPVKDDGDFGPNTKTAVKEFQKKYKLDVDGVVGPKTQAELLTWKTDPAEKPGAVKPIETPGIGKYATVAGIGAAIVAFRDYLFSGDWKTYAFIGGVVLIGGAIAWGIDAYQATKRTYEGTE